MPKILYNSDDEESDSEPIEAKEMETWLKKNGSKK